MSDSWKYEDHVLDAVINPGSALARKRWSTPEAVQARVDAVAKKLEQLPPLTEEQKLRLTRIINGR